MDNNMTSSSNSAINKSKQQKTTAHNTRVNIFRDNTPRITSPNPKTFPMLKCYEYELVRPKDLAKSETYFKLSPRIGKDENGSSILINNNGEKIADGEYIYVLLENDALHLSRPHDDMHHSHLASFKPVKYAGHMRVQDGKIQNIDLISGHYRPARSMEVSLLKQKFADLLIDTETNPQEKDPRNFRERFKALSLSDPEGLLRTQKLSIPDDSLSGNEANRAGDPVLKKVYDQKSYVFGDKISELRYRLENKPSSFSQKEIDDIVYGESVDGEAYQRRHLAESSVPLNDKQIRHIASMDIYAIVPLAISSRPMSDDIIDILHDIYEESNQSEYEMQIFESEFFKSSRKYSPERLQKFYETNNPDTLKDLISSDIFLELSDKQKDMVSRKFVEQIFINPNHHEIAFLLDKNIPLSDEQKKDIVDIIIAKSDKGEFGYKDLLDNHVTSSNFPLSDAQFEKIVKIK